MSLVIVRHFSAVVGDAAVLKHEDAVCEVENAVVVSHDDAGTVGGNSDFAQQVHHPATRACIESGGRFVTHNQTLAQRMKRCFHLAEGTLQETTNPEQDSE